ncbi:AraC-like DNA-binding protein [Rhodoblastus acidophilus]|uniref:helix-turn-helix transcriptional regulator n=1 Tax=Rhodoblastus acidophilus TaxID=1074 RepID=UPI002225B082|nr:AraC family transcriptional regulator [Rhodoblastus acidophilus]MCW2284555.1 AraC-like DNA-binding protein [Rhodoblastus acidophilus]MCW2333508.1 AraC-like DNA-binding protein [Rhodoblastus acidophilus]
MAGKSERGPFASAHDRVVPLHVLSPLIAHAVERGWNAREIFPFLEFEGTHPADDGRRFSYMEARQAYVRARRMLGQELAVEHAFRKSIANYGIVGLGAMVQASAEAALRFALAYQTLAGSVLRLEMETCGEETAVVARDLYADDELGQFWRLDHLLSVVHLLRQLPGATPEPIRFEIEGRLERGLKAILARRLSARILDDADRSCIVYRSRDLCAPLRFPDPAAAHMLRRTADRELAALGRIDARGLVERIVARDGTLRGRREVSAELGISERSLDRLLAREGVRFSEMVALQRIRKAKSFLRDGETVERTAEFLGYSDARSFRRAFQKATGLSPVEFKSGWKATEGGA